MPLWGKGKQRKGKEKQETGGDFYRRHRGVNRELSAGLVDVGDEHASSSRDGGDGGVQEIQHAVRTLETEAEELARLVGAHNKAVAAPSFDQLQEGVHLDFQEAQRQVVALKGVRRTLLQELEGTCTEYACEKVYYIRLLKK